ncbi:MAG TPA: condensation domain-containing protein, partial [Pyrinomonadaceae bacterium]|nr:condensation domain-containing protein [Pyrinomonadaceae bacterium]
MKNVEDIYPLSPMQQGILFHTLYAPDAEIYIEQLGCTFRGQLDTSAFRQAWEKVIDRNPALRTCFVWEGLDEPLQVVKKRVKLPWQLLDWRALSAAEQQRQLEDFFQADRRRSYDLSEAPLLRLSLMQLDAEAFYFIFSHHHLILDGWSVPLLLRELFEFYEAIRSGAELTLEVGRPFSDYIAWLQKQDASRAENYWRETLKGFNAPVSLTPGREMTEHAQQPDAVQGEQRLDLSEETTSALNGLARRHELTLNTIVQGAWAIMLSRYSGETDIVFGAAVAGRPADLAGVETMIGLFINTLPVRVRVRAEERLLAWLKALQAQLVELRQYEYSPLVDVQAWSELGRGRSLFESLLVFENFPVNSAVQEQKGTLRVEDLRWEEASHYPLSMVVVPGRELQLRMEYNTNLFDAATIERMIAHFAELLKEIAAEPEKRLEELSLLTPAERQRMLFEWNEPQIDYPAGRCLHELFEAQAERRPDAVAVKFGDAELTYDELNRRANRLAHELQSGGVKPETLVGILVERSLEMTVGVLGILKAGGAYVPLDPDYPQARLSLILEDAGIEIIVAQERLLNVLPAQEARVVRLEEISETFIEQREDNLVSHVQPDNLAYVIYTSGSTGKPKGALITHRAVVHHDYAIAPRYDLNANDRVLQFASLSFDVAVEEMFPTWLHGGCVVLRTEDALSSPLAFYKFLATERITVVNLPTAFWNEVMREVERTGFDGELALRVAAIGGERGLYEQFALAQRVTGGRVRLLNVYGPTETTVTNTVHLYDASSGERQGIASVPLGRPIGNTPIYI